METEREIRERKLSFSHVDCPFASEIMANIPTYSYKSSSEYAEAVNRWLWQCYHWQSLSFNLPYILMQTNSHAQRLNNEGNIDLNRNFTSSVFNQNLLVFVPGSNNATIQGATSPLRSHSPGSEFVIPSLYKRFAAEVIDFCILLVLKVIITYIAVDIFDFVSNLEKYDLDLIRNDKLDYHKAMELTTEIITLEIIHRFVVCIFEALCIYKGVLGNSGATPGKILMRIRVVSCQTVVSVNSNVIRVYPAENLGLGWALLRSFIKNLSLAFIFPIFFTMYFFQHNRTAYDIICNSIVVEELPSNRNQHN